MSDGLFFALLSLFALMCGGLCYLLFRENTYLSKALEAIVSLAPLRQWVDYPFGIWLSGYLPDFMWGFSLSCGLFAILNPSIKAGLWIVGLVSGLGILWELMQATALLSGTGDGWDVILYLFAAVTAWIILCKKRGQKK